jgi:hypothetical protein
MKKITSFIVCTIFAFFIQVNANAQTGKSSPVPEINEPAKIVAVSNTQKVAPITPTEVKPMDTKVPVALRTVDPYPSKPATMAPLPKPVVVRTEGN